jgi:hypothetical protein
MVFNCHNLYFYSGVNLTFSSYVPPRRPWRRPTCPDDKSEQIIGDQVDALYEQQVRYAKELASSKVIKDNFISGGTRRKGSAEGQV